MSWEPADHIKAWEQGFAIGGLGMVFFTRPHIDHNHERAISTLTERAEAGDEFAGRALAEALRRRMTR